MQNNKHYDTKGLKEEPTQVELAPCVKFVNKAWDDWDSHWSSKFSEFERFYDRWIGKPPTRDEDWQAQFHKRLTWQAEKTLVARFHTALFPTSAPIDIDATEVRDELQGILAKSTVAHWFKIGLISKEFLKGMRSAGIYGTGLFEDDWYLRTEELPEKITQEVDDYRPMINENKEAILDDDGRVKSYSVGKKTIEKIEPRRKVVEDRYRCRKTNIFAWRIHPDKLDDDDDLPVINQEFVNYETLVEREIEARKLGFQGFDNMKDIEKDTTEIKKEDKARLMKDGTFFDEDNPSIELLHYWGLYKDDDVKKSMWITIVNRKFVLRKWDNPRWDKKSPLFHIVWTEDEKPSYYGIGLAQIGKEAEDRANITVNIRTDVKKKNMKGTGWYNSTDKKIKKKDLVDTTPGKMRPCSDVRNAFAYDNPPQLSADDYKEEETAVADHREITGAAPSLMPAANKKAQHETLGGMQLLLSSAIQKLKPDLVMMELMGIRKIANRAFLLTRQYLTKPLWIELLADEDQFKKLQIEKIYQLDPRQIIGKINFYCVGLSESIEKAQNIDKLLKFTEISAKIPPLQMVTNYEGIGKQIMLWLGMENPEKYVRINPEMPLQATPQQGMGQGQGTQGRPPGAQGAPPQGGNGNLSPALLQRIAQSIGQGQAQGQPQQAP